MRTSRARLALALAALGVLLAVPALWLIASFSARPLHPSPDAVPSVLDWSPRPAWANAAAQGRQGVRVGVAEQNLPGASVAVGINGRLVWAEGFGFADLRRNVAVTPKHRFPIGTASIALTSAAAGLLLQDGRLNLADEIQVYTSAFPRKQWPVTVGALMGHTAGVIPDGGDEGPLFARHCVRPVDALPSFANAALLFEPGTQYRFSSYGWILVSAAVEAAAQEPFLAFLERQLFRPLEMRSTRDLPATEADDDFPLVNLFRELIYDPEAARSKGPPQFMQPDRVTSYFPRFAADPRYGLHLMRPVDFSCYAGASAFVSTPSDLVRFGMAMQSGKLLPPATVALLQTTQRLRSGQETGYGLGWSVRTVTLAGRPTPAIGHDGHTLGGMVASLLTIPAYGITVAVTSNIAHANTYAVALKAVEPFLKTQPTI